MKADKDDAPIRVRKQSLNGYAIVLAFIAGCGVTTGAFLGSGYVERKPIVKLRPAANQNPAISETGREAQPMVRKVVEDKKATALAELLSNTKERQALD